MMKFFKKIIQVLGIKKKNNMIDIIDNIDISEDAAEQIVKSLCKIDNWRVSVDKAIGNDKYYLNVTTDWTAREYPSTYAYWKTDIHYWKEYLTVKYKKGKLYLTMLKSILKALANGHDIYVETNLKNIVTIVSKDCLEEILMKIDLEG